MTQQDPSAISRLVTINPEEWFAAVQRAWRMAGHRLTEPRSRVLRSVTAYEIPFSAEQLYADLQQEHAPTGRATVYRTLEQLCSDGWVARIHTGHTESCYSITWPGHLHHLICTSCGKVIPFQGCALGDMIDILAQKTDFTIQGHLLEVYGCCTNCQPLEAPCNHHLPDDS